ncbi:hypothetical protein [Actinocorallia populi]|uniref:hypothetical protein n=1 Tax=Actinocorallia populi TaxID=2079200 RepID=UPI000D0879F8|nr:hypothetical protein [Actinocorallia populi]
MVLLVLTALLVASVAGAWLWQCRASPLDLEVSGAVRLVPDKGKVSCQSPYEGFDFYSAEFEADERRAYRMVVLNAFGERSAWLQPVLAFPYPVGADRPYESSSSTGMDTDRRLGVTSFDVELSRPGAEEGGPDETVRVRGEIRCP